jgi:hypothetical protein
MTSGEANLVVRWIAQELARVGPTLPTRAEDTRDHDAKGAWSACKGAAGPTEAPLGRASTPLLRGQRAQLESLCRRFPLQRIQHLGLNLFRLTSTPISAKITRAVRTSIPYEGTVSLTFSKPLLLPILDGYRQKQGSDVVGISHCTDYPADTV